MVALKITLSIIILLIILILLLLFSNFLVILSVSKKNLTVKIKILGIKFTIPLDEKPKKSEKKPKKESEKEDDETSIMKRFSEFRNEYNRQKSAIIKALAYLKNKITIYETGLYGQFGTGNAASTGMAYGGVHIFFGTIAALLAQYFVFPKPINVNVEAIFDKAVFEIEFKAVIKSKIYYLLRAVLIYLKNK